MEWTVNTAYNMTYSAVSIEANTKASFIMPDLPVSNTVTTLCHLILKSLYKTIHIYSRIPQNSCYISHWTITITRR